MRVKTGLTAKGIIGIIFAPMGFLFTVLGFLASQSMESFDTPREAGIFRAVFCGVGGIFLVLGLIFLGLELRRRMLLQRAVDGGHCVQADVLGVDLQTNVNVNGRNPRVVECAWTDDAGTVHIYRSRLLYTDVTGLLKSTKVPVYMDPYRPEIGYVDVDAILPEIKVHS